MIPLEQRSSDVFTFMIFGGSSLQGAMDRSWNLISTVGNLEACEAKVHKNTGKNIVNSRVEATLEIKDFFRENHYFPITSEKAITRII